MTNEELILQHLEDIKAQITPITKTADKLIELRDDFIPLSNHAFQILIDELQEVEAGFQLEDLFKLIKQGMRSIRNLNFALRQLNNITEFALDIEPLLISSVPQAIKYLDDLEQRGVLRVIKAMMDVRAKVAKAYSPEDIDQIGDGMVGLLGLAKKLSDPQVMTLLEKTIEVFTSIDLKDTKKIGPIGLVSAGFNSEVKEGFGVLIELAKAMGKLKSNGDAISEKPQEISPQ